MTIITEIIPDDIPDWAQDAMDRGQLFNEIVSREDASRKKLEQALGELAEMTEDRDRWKGLIDALVKRWADQENKSPGPIARAEENL